MSADGAVAMVPASRRFQALLNQHKLDLSVRSIDTLQVNLTKTCNQACRHCHVDASPSRTETLSAEGVDACLRILADHAQIKALDLTGGAPELHPQFDHLVVEARRARVDDLDRLGKAILKGQVRGRTVIDLQA